MATLVHADIFFFVTTIALVFVSILAIIALYYVIRILRDIDEVSKKAKVEAGEIIADVRSVREKVREAGMKTAGVLAFVSRFIKLVPKRVKKKGD